MTLPRAPFNATHSNPTRAPLQNAETFLQMVAITNPLTREAQRMSQARAPARARPPASPHAPRPACRAPRTSVQRAAAASSHLHTLTAPHQLVAKHTYTHICTHMLTHTH